MIKLIQLFDKSFNVNLVNSIIRQVLIVNLVNLVINLIQLFDKSFNVNLVDFGD